MSSCYAGILCAVVSQPADNMVSMLSANPKATMGSVLKSMGLVNLAIRGLPLRILMVGTLTGLQWGIYDAYKVCSWSSFECITETVDVVHSERENSGMCLP
jgi:hypothetical protein